jgi:hypothetical protein
MKSPLMKSLVCICEVLSPATIRQRAGRAQPATFSRLT